jgi:hypothetical protein
MMRRLGLLGFSLAMFVTACGNSDTAASDTTTRTKNAAIGITTQAPLIEQCSALGAIYRSNPIVVLPPEGNAEDEEYTSGDCSFADSYRRVNFGEIGRYTFTWSSGRAAKPVVVEISRDGVLWQALSTQWSPSVPNSATADVKLKGDFRVRVRPAASK